MAKQQYTYIPDGKVCSNKIVIETDGNSIENVQVVGGCHGNSQGITSLLRGMNVDNAISRLEGITCGKKDTSCPDQIAKALNQIAKALKEMKTK